MKRTEALTELIPGEDYYMENGLIVMTAVHHKKRARCCGNGCKWCPYEPKHEPGATLVTRDSEFWKAANSAGKDQAQS